MSAPNQVQSNSLLHYNDLYVERTSILTANTGADVLTLTFQYHKMGNMVTVRITGLANTVATPNLNQYTCAGNVSGTVGIPLAFRPDVACDIDCPSLDNTNIRHASLLSFGADGTLIVAPVDALTFVAPTYIANAHGMYYIR